MSKPDLYAIDVGLEEAIEDTRRWCARLKHGRLFLVLNVIGGRVAEHRLEADSLTVEDLERLMQEPPKVRAGVSRCR